MQVTFRIYEEGYQFPSTGKLVKTFTEEAISDADVNALYQECRQVWGDYMVEAEVDGYIQSSSCTYREELRKQLEEEELQWEYMNGEYDDEY